MWRLAYLLSIFIFAGLAILIEIKLRGNYFKKHLKIFLIATIIFVIYVFPAEAMALSYRIWQYTSGKTFGVFLKGPALETIIFMIFIASAITGAILIFGNLEENKKSIPEQAQRILKNEVKKIENNI